MAKAKRRYPTIPASKRRSKNASLILTRKSAKTSPILPRQPSRSKNQSKNKSGAVKEQPKARTRLFTARKTRSQTRVPMEKVFGESNLLQMVLLEVPTIDILVNAQRVCKAFKETVDESLSIQRRLFFRPEAAPLAYETDVCMFTAEYKPPDQNGLHEPLGVVKCARTGTELTMNPFVLALWPAPNPYTSLQSWFLEFPGYFARQGSRYNEITPRYWINSPPKVLEVKFFFDEYPSPSNVRGVRRHGIDYANASWRRMLLTQPPVSGAACTSCAEEEEEKSELVVKSGITLEDMVEEKKRREIAEEDDNHEHWGDCNRFMMDLGPLEIHVLETETDEVDGADDQKGKEEAEE